MQWSSNVSRLTSVRDMRLGLAELMLAKAERDLAARHEAESKAGQRLIDVTQRSLVEQAEANNALLQVCAGGRLGISDWVVARKRAQDAVTTARREIDKSVAERLDAQRTCSAARERWRNARLSVERLRLLAARIQRDPE